jgi:hypothetical protein
MYALDGKKKACAWALLAHRHRATVSIVDMVRLKLQYNYSACIILFSPFISFKRLLCTINVCVCVFLFVSKGDSHAVRYSDDGR